MRRIGLWLTLITLLGGVSLAKTLPGQAPAGQTGDVRSSLVLTVANPKEFQLSGDVSWFDKSSLKLNANEQGTAAWQLPESLAGKAVEIRFTATVAAGEAEVYLLPPKTAVTVGQQTLRRGDPLPIRLAMKLPPKADGQTTLRFNLRPRTNLQLTALQIYIVQRQ